MRYYRRSLVISKNSPMLNPKESRTETRKLLRCPAKVTLKNTAPQLGRTIDISPSGISVMVSEHMTPGIPCVVAFDPSINGKTITVNAAARVIYSICVGTTGFRTGFQFVEIDETTARSIRALAK